MSNLGFTDSRGLLGVLNGHYGTWFFQALSFPAGFWGVSFSEVLAFARGLHSSQITYGLRIERSSRLLKNSQTALFCGLWIIYRNGLEKNRA
jgi:hypothetical protein